MNREQARKLRKNARKNGIDPGVTDLYLHMKKAGFDKPSDPKEIQTGDLVTLDLDRIMSRRDYERMAPAYREFVEHSDGVVFKAMKERENLISLQEEPKWLFWSGDLQIVSRGGPAEGEGGEE